MIVYKGEHFYLEQQEACPIPGYLILRLNQEARSLAQLSSKALEQLGPVMAAAMKAIDDTVHPERIYVIRLGEEAEAIHFHFFPRTSSMADLYQTHHSGQSVNGALLFDWARRPEVTAQLRFALTCDKAASEIQKQLERNPACR